VEGPAGAEVFLRVDCGKREDGKREEGRGYDRSPLPSSLFTLPVFLS
jgi:hypothetical protein